MIFIAHMIRDWTFVAYTCGPILSTVTKLEVSPDEDLRSEDKTSINKHVFGCITITTV